MSLNRNEHEKGYVLIGWRECHESLVFPTPPGAVVQDLLTWGTDPGSAVCLSSVTGKWAEWALCGCLWHLENETWNKSLGSTHFLSGDVEEWSRNHTRRSGVRSVCRSPLSSVFSSAFSATLFLSLESRPGSQLSAPLCSNLYSARQSSRRDGNTAEQSGIRDGNSVKQILFTDRLPDSVAVAYSTGRVTQPSEGCFLICKLGKINNSIYLTE